MHMICVLFVESSHRPGFRVSVSKWTLFCKPKRQYKMSIRYVSEPVNHCCAALTSNAECNISDRFCARVILWCSFNRYSDRHGISGKLRWLNTVWAVCEYMLFAKSWQEKGCSSQAETWQVKNILMKDFDWQVKCDVFIVSMATWTIEYNLKISLLLSLHKIRPLDFPIN